MFQPDPERRLIAIPWKIKAPYQSGEAIRREDDTGAKQTGAINTARPLGKLANQLRGDGRSWLPIAQI
jgi:hypothetical protein